MKLSILLVVTGLAIVHGYTLSPLQHIGAATRCVSPLLTVNHDGGLEPLKEARARPTAGKKGKKGKKDADDKKEKEEKPKPKPPPKADKFGAAPDGFEWGGIY